ncbi:MAG: leucine-rich repeat protein, partial [Rikenellaceae bacterium]
CIAYGGQVFNFDDFSGLLYDGAPAIPFSLSSGVTTLYAEIYDELNNVGVDIYTKANLDEITPSSRWSVEIEEGATTDGVTEYTMTLRPINIDEDIVSGFAKITAVDSDGNKSSQVVEFEYVQMDEVVTMTMAELANSNPSTDALWIITNSSITDYSNLQTAKYLYFPNLTAVESGAFYSESNEYASLVSIELPEVTSIDSNAFYQCTSLQSVTLATESTLESVGDNIFYGIESMEEKPSLTIGSSNSDFVKLDAVNNKATFGNREYQFLSIIVVQQ